MLHGQVDAAILRYIPSVLDSSADPDARVPQLIVADTAAECPSSDVGDGDVCYGKDSDIHRIRQNGAWVTVSVTTHSHTLVGDVDGDVGTTDLNEAAVEAEIESVVDLADLQGILTVAKGGTGSAPASDDQVLVSNSTSDASWKSVPDCHTGSMLTYTASSNTWGCEADDGGTGDDIRVEDGDDAGTYTAATGGDFSDSGDVNFVLSIGSVITATLRADSVALTTDTTGNYAAGDAEAGAALTGDSATGFFGAGALEDARVDGSLEADEVVLAGDVDGAADANDIDQAAVEAELEGVMDLPDLQGQITDAQIADGAVDGGNAGEIADASVTADDLGADSVSASELNEAGVEAGLEGVLDLDDLQGTLADSKLANNYSGVGTCTNQFARVLSDNAAPTCATVLRSDVSASLITDQYAFTLYDPNGLVATDDIPSIVPNRARAVTITEVWCESNDGTGVINLQRDDGSAANILSSNCTCANTGTACTIDTAEDNLADGDNIDFVFVSETAVTRLNVQITYTVD